MGIGLGKTVRRVLRWGAWLVLAAVLVAFSLTTAFFCMEAAYPFEVARDVLSNGTKTVVVEGMAHVGSPNFYGQVREDISREKSGGAAYLYEGVHDDAPPPQAHSSETTPVSDSKAEITSILMGGRTRPDVDINRLYGLLAKAAGLEVQPQSSFMDLGGGPDVNADMSTNELLGRLKAAQARDKAVHTSTPALVPSASDSADQLDLDALENGLSKMTPREKAVTSFLVKGTISSILRLSQWMDLVPYGEDIDDARTHVLADAIVARKEARIVVTYGMRHVDGLLADLQAMDSQWKRVERTWRRPFQ